MQRKSLNEIRGIEIQRNFYMCCIRCKFEIEMSSKQQKISVFFNKSDKNLNKNVENDSFMVDSDMFDESELINDLNVETIEISSSSQTSSSVSNVSSKRKSSNQPDNVAIKRKRSSKNINTESQSRNYQKSWEFDYFVSQIVHENSTIQRCLLCWNLPESQQPVLGKIFNIKNHYDKKHAFELDKEGIGIENCKMNETSKRLRSVKINNLLEQVQKQRISLHSTLQPSQQHYIAGLKCSEVIALKNKAFSDGDFGQKIGLKILETILPSIPGLTQKNMDDILSNYEKVPCTRWTIARRTEVSF
jgi:hypothetical protein